MYHREEVKVEFLEALIECRQKKYASRAEVAALYSVGIHTMDDLIKESGAARKIKGRVLINIDVLNNYIEEHYGYESEEEDELENN
ncbi:MAG: hypothetical protein HUJ70_13340 [Pseudobutyrivibrio sp.]|nr:hypothetical protein [Pseudobutyrivibrio sp.]